MEHCSVPLRDSTLDKLYSLSLGGRSRGILQILKESYSGRFGPEPHYVSAASYFGALWAILVYIFIGKKIFGKKILWEILREILRDIFWQKFKNSE